MSEISYSKKNDRIECVRYKDWRKSYPPHTHTGHMTVGYIEEGRVCIVLNGEAKIYGAGEQFFAVMICLSSTPSKVGCLDHAIPLKATVLLGSLSSPSLNFSKISLPRIAFSMI